MSETKPEIFISHAQKDKKLADAFFLMLSNGLGLTYRDFFCSSLEGMGIPEGVNFSDFIKSKERTAKLIILLVSYNYHQSIFCLCELGASWMLSNSVFPILIPDLDYENVKAVLTGTQVGKINDKTTLNNLKDRITNILKLASVDSAVWEVRRDSFLEQLESNLKQIDFSHPVSQEVYKLLEEKYKISMKDSVSLQAQLAEKDKVISELSRIKDEKKVGEVLAKYAKDEWEIFESLVSDIKADLERVPHIVIKVFRENMIETGYKPEDGDEWQIIQPQIKRKFLYQGRDGDIWVNEGDSAIKKAAESAQRLKDFIRSKSSSPVQ